MELEPSSYEEALEVLRQYPFFAYEALKALDLAPDAEAKARMKAILAVNVGEISDLREILGLNSDSLTDFYPDSVPPQLTTDDTIATFLDHFGHQPARTRIRPGRTLLRPGLRCRRFRPGWLRRHSSRCAHPLARSASVRLHLPTRSPILGRRR